MKNINLYICPCNSSIDCNFTQLKDSLVNYIDWRNEDCDFYDECSFNSSFWTTKSAFNFLKRISLNEGFKLYDNYEIKRDVYENNIIEIYQPLNQEFKVHNYFQKYDNVGKSEVLRATTRQIEQYADTSFPTGFHKTFYGSNSVSETLNLNAPNDKSIFVFADSMVIPIAPILCASFKRCVIFDNRFLDYDRFNLDEFDYVIGLYQIQNIANTKISEFLKQPNHKVKPNFLDIYTVNFNTSLFTNMLIMSILCNLKSFKYRFNVFDNSNIEKFELIPQIKKIIEDRNIEFRYIDNTKKQIIDLEQDVILKNGIQVEREGTNCLGSARHSYTIEWIINNSDNNFILFDSDTFLIKDIDFIDTENVCISDIEQLWWANKNRFLPIIQYFNVEKIRKLGIKFFDYQQILGLKTQKINLDTGGSFHSDVIEKTHDYSIINQNDYILHFAHGSWKNIKYKNNYSLFEYCEKCLSYVKPSININLRPKYIKTVLDVVNIEIQNRIFNSYLEIFSDGSLDVVNCEHIMQISYKSTNNFFKLNKQKFDLILIDGLHQSDKVETDIENALKNLNPNGMIIVHDCNPIDKSAQTYNRSSGRWNGDVWKAFVKYRFKSEYLTYTYTFDYGCGIIDTSNKTDISNNKLREEIDNMSYSDMTYEWFIENKEELLNLKDYYGYY